MLTERPPADGGEYIDGPSVPHIDMIYPLAGPRARQLARISLLQVEPKVSAPLDPGFAPLVLGKKKYKLAAKDCTQSVEWALPRADGCARYSLKVFPEDSVFYETSLELAGVLIQEMIWRCAATELQLAGPAKICEDLKKAYSVVSARTNIVGSALSRVAVPIAAEPPGRCRVEPSRSKRTPCRRPAGARRRSSR